MCSKTFAFQNPCSFLKISRVLPYGSRSLFERIVTCGCLKQHYLRTFIGCSGMKPHLCASVTLWLSSQKTPKFTTVTWIVHPTSDKSNTMYGLIAEWAVYYPVSVRIVDLIAISGPKLLQYTLSICPLTFSA